MTRKEVFRKIGLAVQGFTDSARRKFVIALDAEKAKLDPETRRKVRIFWGFVSAVTFVFWLRPLLRHCGVKGCRTNNFTNGGS